MMLSTTVLANTVLAGIALQVLTLEQAVDIARHNHPELQVAGARVEATRARARVQRAPLLPQVDGAARYTVSAGNVQEEGFWSFDHSRSYSAGVSGSWLLWDHQRTRDRFRAARENIRSVDQARQITERDVVLAVQLAYFEARARKELVAVARDTLDNEQRHLEQVGAFVTIGTRPEIDLARVRTTVANARAQLIRADSDYSAAKARLNQAMGVIANTNYDVADANLALAATSNDQAPEQTAGQATDELARAALISRPEFAQIESDMRAQAIELRQVSRGLWPSVHVNASTGYSGMAIRDPGWDAAIGVSLSWPLFDGHATTAATRVEELDLVILEAQKVSLEQRVWLEIDEARLAVHTAVAGRAAAEQALVSARELLRLAEGRYQAGVGNIIELGDAQVAVTNAAAQVVQADYDEASARARLARAAGVGP